MTHDASAYGLWTLVVLNSLVFIFFAFSFGKPQTPREMYGFPLTIYLLSGWLQVRYAGADLLSHDAGHLWWTIFGLRGDPHSSALHLLSYAFIGGGFLLLAAAWRVLYQAQKHRRLATSGTYVYVRHPQYVAFIVIMFGFLLQWPTLLMFPVLVGMYVHLAHSEEKDARAEFGAEYDRYAARVPAWFPRLSGRAPTDQPSAG